MPVHVWGNVREPGVHYVPAGSTLLQSVSAAGGPTENADTKSIRLLRDKKYTYVDLLKADSSSAQANDTLFVDSSIKADLPLYFTGISTVISIVTLYYVLSTRK